MKYFGILVGICFILATGCSQTPNPASSPSNHDHSSHQMNGQEHAHHQHETMERGEASDISIYNLDGQWENQRSEKIRLGDDKGQVVVLAMIYASCKGACPRIIADMRRIEDECKSKHPGHVRYKLVTFDPEVDTPEKLQKLAEDSGLGSDWELLRGSSEQALELSALLGVKYRKTNETDYAHSNIITVLNGEGEIAFQQEGLGVKPDETVAAVEKLLGK